jgi:hypothetical protein
MFLSKTLNNIVKKTKLYQHRFQSNFCYDYKVDEKSFFKLTENIQMMIESCCSSVAILTFMNEKQEPIKVPKHMTLKKLDPKETVPTVILDDIETLQLIRFRSYKMFWKKKVILRDQEKL